jgi:hypothetical protein
MKSLLRFFRRILPHLTLILALMMLCFFVIDLFNESMAFLNNTITKTLLAVFSCLSAALSVLSVWKDESQR